MRIVVVLLLAFTVPLQGFAAASGGPCMALDQHDAGAHSPHGDDADGHHHGHDNGQPPAKAAHCAPCAACCASAAIAGFTPGFFADRRADAVMVAAPSSLAGIQPETLDRPPLAL